MKALHQINESQFDSSFKLNIERYKTSKPVANKLILDLIYVGSGYNKYQYALTFPSGIVITPQDGSGWKVDDICFSDREIKNGERASIKFHINYESRTAPKARLIVAQIRKDLEDMGIKLGSSYTNYSSWEFGLGLQPENFIVNNKIIGRK